MVSSKSLSERPTRSIAQAMTTSNFRQLASLSMESRPGRPFRPLAPEMPASLRPQWQLLPWRAENLFGNIGDEGRREPVAI